MIVDLKFVRTSELPGWVELPSGSGTRSFAVVYSIVSLLAHRDVSEVVMEVCIPCCHFGCVCKRSPKGCFGYTIGGNKHLTKDAIIGKLVIMSVVYLGKCIEFKT